MSHSHTSTEPQRFLTDSSQAHLLEWLPVGVALFDRNGRSIFRNAAWTGALATDGAEAIHGEVPGLLAKLAAGSEVEAEGCGLEPTTTRVIGPLGNRYHLGGGAVRLPAHGESILVLTLVPCPGEVSSSDTLQARYGLTSRETCIAKLISQGTSNAKIAAELRISSSTARKHTERIFRKLGVRSRAAVAARVLGG